MYYTVLYYTRPYYNNICYTILWLSLPELQQVALEAHAPRGRLGCGRNGVKLIMIIVNYCGQ